MSYFRYISGTGCIVYYRAKIHEVTGNCALGPVPTTLPLKCVLNMTFPDD